MMTKVDVHHVGDWVCMLYMGNTVKINLGSRGLLPQMESC